MHIQRFSYYTTIDEFIAPNMSQLLTALDSRAEFLFEPLFQSHLTNF